MHIMKSCPNAYNVAMSLTKNSIYKHQFDKKLLALVESGLSQHYLNIENDKLAKLDEASTTKIIVEPLNFPLGYFPGFSAQADIVVEAVVMIL